MPYAIPPVKVKITEAVFEKITITPASSGAKALVVTDYSGAEERILLREDGFLHTKNMLVDAKGDFGQIMIIPLGRGEDALIVTDFTGAETRIILREDGLLDAQMVEVGQPRKFLTVREYAKLVGKSPSTIRRWIRQKKLRAIRLSNGQYLIIGER